MACVRKRRGKWMADFRDAVGHFLQCNVCGRKEHPTQEDADRYFRTGWPLCCAQTMLLRRHPTTPSTPGEAA